MAVTVKCVNLWLVALNYCIIIRKIYYLCRKKRNYMDARIVYGYEAAAKVCGVSPGTIANWVKNGKLSGCYNKASERKIAFSVEKLEQRVFGNL